MASWVWRGALAVVAGVALGAGTLGFVPALAGALPDGRGYELVSPMGKHGGDVMADATQTRASVSGDAVSWVSLTPFGDAVGSGVATTYVSERGRNVGKSGWSTHAIVPRVDPLSGEAIGASQDTAYQADFSDDLSSGVLHSYTPLTNDLMVSGVSNLYLRTDLLSPGAGSYMLLTACPGCTSPLDDPDGIQRVAGATPDFGHIIFESHDRLTTDAPQGSGPFVYEWDHGTVRLAGILPDGSPASVSVAGAGASFVLYTPHTISADGSKVFFTVPTQTAAGALYMRVDHMSTVRLNASQRSTSIQSPATYLTATADGSKVFFQDDQQLTTTPGGNLYVYDTTLPASDPNRLRHVFSDQQPADGTALTGGILGVSDDGSYVYFLDPSALLPNQQPLPSAAPIGVYLAHNGLITFIGSMDLHSAGAVSLPAAPIFGFNSRVTPDGKTLLFASFTGTGLTGYDHGQGCSQGSCRELYLYNADRNQLRCISCNPTGAPATSDAAFSVRVSTGATIATNHLNHPLTEDGQHVFFETGEPLVPQDTNAKIDVYEYDTVDGSLHLVTSAKSLDDSHFLEATPDGHDVFFTTSQQLVGWDTDNSYDLYDARIGGGFPEPPPAKPHCTGDTCQGAILMPPAAGTPSTATFSGRGNVRKAAPRVVRHCRHGKVRRRVHGKLRCVRRHAKAHRRR